MKKILFILCWGTNMDEYPFHMVHQNYYSSKKLALEAMDKLITENEHVPECYAIAEDQYLNQLVGIREVEMDHFRF